MGICILTLAGQSAEILAMQSIRSAAKLGAFLGVRLHAISKKARDGQLARTAELSARAMATNSAFASAMGKEVN